MITRFKLFNENLIPYDANLSYAEVLDLYKLDRVIKEYFTEKYPSEHIKILGKYGRTMGKSVLDNLLKFAKKHKDIELIDLIKSHLNTIKNFNDNREEYRAAKKYNL